MMLSRTSKALMTGKSLSFESATVWFSPCPLMNEHHHWGSMKIACKTQNLLSGLGFFSRAVYLHRDIEKLLCDSRRTHLWAHSSFFFFLCKFVLPITIISSFRFVTMFVVPFCPDSIVFKCEFSFIKTASSVALVSEKSKGFQSFLNSDYKKVKVRTHVKNQMC